MKTFARSDNRRCDQLRPIAVIPGFLKRAHGSALISAGDTRVLCTATLESGVPDFLAGKGRGWLTAEYAMLPASTNTRKPRETLKPDGRTIEIRRLIGRALRAAVDTRRLGENTLWLDCDVLEADGGTRTLAVTGAWVALALAVRRMMDKGRLTQNPIVRQVAAVSVGIIDARPMLDLNYSEDSRADVDMNVIMTDTGRFIEIQGTAEAQPFNGTQLQGLLRLARNGCRQLLQAQREAIG